MLSYHSDGCRSKNLIEQAFHFFLPVFPCSGQVLAGINQHRGVGALPFHTSRMYGPEGFGDMSAACAVPTMLR